MHAAIDASNEPTILNYKSTHFRSCYTCEHDERSYRVYKTIYSCNVNSFVDSMMIFGSPRAFHSQWRLAARYSIPGIPLRRLVRVNTMFVFRTPRRARRLDLRLILDSHSSGGF